MNLKTVLAAGFVVLLAAGAATAADTGSTDYATSDTERVTDADVDAAYENGTVTLTLVDEGNGESAGVASATVDVQREYQDDEERADDEEAYERLGTTDADGTITFDPAAQNESRNVTTLELRFEKGAFNAELEYHVGTDSLSLIKEEYEYEHEYEYEQAAAPGYNNTTKQGGQLNVSMTDARATANAALSEAPQGDWRLVEAEAHEEDNYYKFEYVLVNADYPGEAEIRVDGTSGEIIKYEVEIEQEEEKEYENEQEEQENEQEEQEEERENEQEEQEEERENEQEEQEEQEEDG